MFKCTLWAFCLATYVGICPYPTLAQDAPTEEVHFMDLDLRTPAGVNTLDTRIMVAARKVCRKVNYLGTFKLLHIRNCRKEAVDHVRPIRDDVIANAKRRQGVVEIVSLSVTPNAKTR